MNKSTQKNSFSIRQTDLLRQIYEALQEQDFESISLAKSQWVHRFGMSSLPEDQNIEDLFISESIPKKIEERKELLPREGISSLKETISQENLFTEIENLDNKDDEIKTENETIIEINSLVNSENKDVKGKNISSNDNSDEIVNGQSYNLIKQEKTKNRKEIFEDEKSITNSDNSLNKELINSHIYDDLIVRQEREQELKNKLEEAKNSDDIDNIEVLPPPPPSINNLRRWLD